MPRVAVAHCLETLNESIDGALQTLDDAGSFYKKRPDGSFEHIGIRRIETVACIAHLEIHLAWEDFLEGAFIRFLCGAPTKSGTKPHLQKPVFKNTLAALNDVLRSRDYATWNVEDIKRRATDYFAAGGPFDLPIRAAQSDLKDASIIRNRIAHRSNSAAEKFRAVVRKRLGSVPPGMTPGRFLLARAPSIPGDLRLIDHYASIVRAIGRTIVT